MPLGAPKPIRDPSCATLDHLQDTMRRTSFGIYAAAKPDAPAAACLITEATIWGFET